VSRDVEVDTNVSCKESTVSPHTGLIFWKCHRIMLMWTQNAAVMNPIIELNYLVRLRQWGLDVSDTTEENFSISHIRVRWLISARCVGRKSLL